MPKIVKRASAEPANLPAEPKQPKPAANPRRQATMKKYFAKQEVFGLQQVKTWVPASMVGWLRQLGADARDLHRGHQDPMRQINAKLPRLKVPE